MTNSYSRLSDMKKVALLGSLGYDFGQFGLKLAQFWSNFGPKLPDFDPLDQKFQPFPTNSYSRL